MNCQKCNFQNKPDSQFCGNCGAKLKPPKNRIKTYLVLGYVIIATALLLWFNRTLLSEIADLFNITLHTSAIIILVTVGIGIVAGLFCKFRLTIFWLLSPILFSSIYSTCFYSDYNKEIDFNYESQIMNVPTGVSLQEAAYLMFPKLKEIEDKTGICGAKLLAEMSADTEDKPFSSFDEPEQILMKNLSELKLKHYDNPENIVAKIISKNVNVDIGTVQSGGFFFSSFFTINIDIYNPTNKSVTAIVEQGQMLEVQALDVQNIVVYEEKQVELQPKERKSISIKAYCAAENRGSPTGKPVKFTPFVLNIPSSAFTSQENVWNHIKPAQDYYTITFYAWGTGDRTPSGISKFGHAFVNIPNIGTFGFSGASGKMLYDETGKVYDHTKHIPYATYRCDVRISKDRLRNVKFKFWEWRDKPPHYTVGRYDCTTFVMDIADAAGIYYGSRWQIQSPVGFMEELKARNER